MTRTPWASWRLGTANVPGGGRAGLLNQDPSHHPSQGSGQARGQPGADPALGITHLHRDEDGDGPGYQPSMPRDMAKLKNVSYRIDKLLSSQYTTYRSKS